MTLQDTGQTWKYLTGLTVAILLMHVCVVKTLDFPETCFDSQFNYTDWLQHHIIKRDAVKPTTTMTTTNDTLKSIKPLSTVMHMSMRINKIFETSLTNQADPKFIFFVARITSAIENSYKILPNYVQGSVHVIGFRSGSIIADYTINTTNSNMDVTAANIQVFNILAAQGIPLAQDAFAECEEKILTSKDKFYPLQDVELRCTRPNSVVGTMKWSVNDNNLAGNSSKYTIINDDIGSTLIVKVASESDSGTYSCIIQSFPIPYIQWQTVSIEPQPNIKVDKTDVQLLCQDQTVPLTCCADGYTIEWSGISAGDVVINSGPGCITLQHKILSTNCGSKEIFTCQLKDMPELQTFDYSRRTVQVQTVNGYDCINDMLGVGKIGDNVTGHCEKGLEGYITYECKQINVTNVWAELQRDCVLQAFKDLERRYNVLDVNGIPVFMTDLRNTVVQNNTVITQSADTVKAIVDILNTIASISQTITINQPVMEDFLKTVDIILSDESKNTWTELNNGTKTLNKSTELLKAIETMSDRLSDDDYIIKETSIQLHRKTITNSFTKTFSLPNSTTQIVIPNVLKPTLITIIIFKNLDNVLPTRNTSNNDKTSGNHINGDVVVVRVDEAINNISFTFNTMNTSLTNPQCVFWNFSLDHWDSSGCKVKRFENKTVTCECNHTTSFSILMSPFAIDNPALAYITYIGVAISIASLLLCLIIEAIVWKSYMRHVSIVNIAVSLLIANICFFIAAAIADQEQTIAVGRCSPVVFFMHFFYLAVFFWMFISALLLLFRTVTVFSQMSRINMMVIAYTVGYCAPLLIAVITVAFTAGPKHYVSRENACWLNWYESKALLAFVIPALTTVCFNLLVLIGVVMRMRRIGVNEKQTLVVIVQCVTILTPISGLTWGFGIGTMVSREFGIHMIFAIFNSLQGFFVLVFGTLSDRKVRESLPTKLLLQNLISNCTRSTNAESGVFVLNVNSIYDARSVSSYSSSDSSTASNTD